jgi:hypothetical protein
MLEGNLDLILISRTPELIPEVQKIKNVYPDIPITMWNTDERAKMEDWGKILDLAKLVDYNFVVGGDTIEEWKEYNPSTIWLPQGIQPERYEVTKMPPKDKKEFSCEVAFIGNCNPAIHVERHKIISAVWDKYDMKWWKEAYGERHNKAVMGAKVCLGVSAFPDRPLTWSVRNWKYIAAGGIVLEHSRDKRTKEFFQNNIETYMDAGDAVKKVKLILDNYSKYKQKARRLRVWARKHHCYSNRIDEIERLINAEKNTG